MADSYDLIIIGAGPGGYVAAIRAAQLGLKTAIVEREHMAGICSNWGCIPTKALLRTAEVYGHMAHAKDYGLTAEKFGFDLAAIVKRSRAIAAQMNNGVQFLMKKNKVDIIWGEAVLTAPGEITVAPTKKPADAAAGAAAQECARARAPTRPRTSSSRPAPGRACCPASSRTATASGPISRRWCRPKCPKSLVVMGSGAIGMEFASFYRSMGAEVTVIELLPQILPVEDAEIAAHVRKRFEKRGIKILTDAKVAKVEKSEDRHHRPCRTQGWLEAADFRRPADLGGRRAVQHRESRARKARRKNRPRRHRHRRSRPHQCGRRLGHRRRCRPADAGAQGRARSRHRGRDHRRHEGPRARQN